MHTRTLLLAGVAFIGTAAPYAQSTTDPSINDKIRKEEAANSQVMRTEHFLADVYGPRLTGSPSHKAAAEWAVKTMTSWGMTNGKLVPFTWRGISWLPGRATGVITSPVSANLKFEAVPWPPSSAGTVSGEVVVIAPPETPADAELTA